VQKNIFKLGAKLRGEELKSMEILPYLGNGDKYGQGYYLLPMGSGICSFR